MTDDKSTHPLAAAETPQDRSICGFWSRLLAIGLDCVTLVVAGYDLGLFLGDQFAQMGRWGRLVGLGIALAYFGVLNSCIGEGKTLGKRLMGIRVVGEDGRCISTVRSLVRSAILSSLYFLLPLIPDLGLTLLNKLVNVLLPGLGVGMVYLYVFNKRTRQSLHDLIVGTYVVRRAAVGEISSDTVNRIHYVVLGALGVILFATTAWMSTSEPSSDLLAIHKKLSQMQGIEYANVKFTKGQEGGSGDSGSDGFYLEHAYGGPEEFIEAEIGVKSETAFPKTISTEQVAEGATDRGDWFHSLPDQLSLPQRAISSAKEATGPITHSDTTPTSRALAHPPPTPTPAFASAVTKEAASIILDTYPHIESKKGIIVKVIYGYDIGIASVITTHKFSAQVDSVTGWKELREQLEEM